MISGFLWSGLTGLALAPLLASLGHLGLEVTATGRGARLLSVLSLGIASAVLGRLPRPRVSRPLAGVVLLAAAAGAGSALFGLLPGPPGVLLGLPVALAAGALILSGGAVSRSPGALLLGGAAGLLALELWVLPRVGFLPPLAGSVLLLPFVCRRVPAAAPPGGRVRGLVDLALLGCVGAYLLELARPFLMQHISGARYSHVASTVVVLVGLGLGSLVGVPRRLRAASRIVAPLLMLAAAYLTWRAIFGLRPGILLPEEDPRLSELRVAQIVFGVASVVAGWWLRVGWEVVSSSGHARPVCSGLAALLLAAGLGMAGAHSTLARYEQLPTVAVDLLDKLVRRNPKEILSDRLVTPDGLLRLTRDMTRPERGEGALWQGREASRDGSFAALERAEISFTGQLAEQGGRLLIVGRPSAAHAEALAEGIFDTVVDQPVLPGIGDATDLSSSARPPDEGYDAVVVLSSPFLSREAARSVSIARLAGLVRRSRVLVAWFDLRAVEPEAVAATARALRAVVDDVRVWIALDGYRGPLLALSCGGGRSLREGDAGQAVVRSLPVDGLAPGVVAGPWFPLAELRARLEPDLGRSLAAAPILDWLAQLAQEADQGILGGALEALAVHAAAFYDVELQLEYRERERITDEEVSALLRVAARAPDDELVLHQARAFAELAYGKAEYERLLAVVGPLLEVVDDTELLGHAARSHFQLLDDLAAIELLERATANGLEDAATYVLLGRAYVRAGDPVSASSVLELARSLGPTDTRTCRSLGLALAAVGRHEDALPYLEGVAAEHPDDTEVNEVLERLRELSLP